MALPKKEKNKSLTEEKGNLLIDETENEAGDEIEKDNKENSFQTEERNKLSMEEKNKLAEENMALVYHVVKSFANTGVHYDELCSVAYVGYAKALDTYDLDRDVKFSTYAYNCIKNEILFFLRKEKKHKNNNLSLNKVLSVDKNGNSLSLGSTISTEDFGEISVEEKLILDETVEYLKKIIDSLPPNEQYIILHRFGINGAEPKTQKEIADYIGMSQANVSKLEKSITEKIKRLLGTRHKIRNFDI